MDGPEATIRAATLPATPGPLKASAVPTRQATPTAPQAHAPFRWHRPARALSTSGDFPNPDIRCAFPPVPRPQGLSCSLRIHAETVEDSPPAPN
ncbi:hypothetical protein SGFS_100110 [Streptomyces graminofaciens]|uniref:Uncharacterized protein n=1 Tax=Streptomyces graminofaciens TaxID=68212 RepID=A0ABM7FQY2_9ACTN|nr:hypothetical protein SGFS_100110 [Streptomyces graminofaciens]